jgi:hypothetical protein
MQTQRLVSGAVEGWLDEVVLRRLIRETGGAPGTIYGGNGKQHLLRSLSAYNQAAHFAPWAVLIDLDSDADCAPLVLPDWLPNPAPHMCCRVVVREVEAWLMADRERLAAYLSVPVSRLPTAPDSVADPKQVMVNLARQSRSRHVRADMVPRPESARLVGPAYAARLMQFVEDLTNGWRPEVAAAASDSLARCMRRLRELCVAPE